MDVLLFWLFALMFKDTGTFFLPTTLMRKMMMSRFLAGGGEVTPAGRRRRSHQARWRLSLSLVLIVLGLLLILIEICEASWKTAPVPPPPRNLRRLLVRQQQQQRRQRRLLLRNGREQRQEGQGGAPTTKKNAIRRSDNNNNNHHHEEEERPTSHTITTKAARQLISSSAAAIVEAAAIVADNKDDDDSGSCLPCHISKVEASFEQVDDDDDVDETEVTGTDTHDIDNDNDHLYSCIQPNDLNRGYYVELNLPESFIDLHGRDIASGSSDNYFCVPKQYVVDGNSERRLFEKGQSQSLSELSQQSLETSTSSSSSQRNQQQPPSHNHTELLSGTKRLLAVRVTSSLGEEPVESRADIEAAIFGTNNIENEEEDNDNNSFGIISGTKRIMPVSNVVDQYKAISRGKLKLQPATGNGITNGILEITLPQGLQVQGSRVQSDLANIILESTSLAMGGLPLDEIADRIIFCLPNYSELSGRDSWTAFTYLFEPYSFYQLSRCTKLSVVMHELGHSFGFRHSGTFDTDYGDETGYMGYAVNRYGLPRKAFNAHKHWVGGWFNDRSIHINPISQLQGNSDGAAVVSGAAGGRLVSFVDADHPDLTKNDVALVRVGENLFIQYNRPNRYNADTPVALTGVIITEATSPLDQSTAIARLSNGDAFVYKDYDEARKFDLIIEICDEARQHPSSFDYVVISIHLDDGVQSSICRHPNAFRGAVPGADGDNNNHNVWFTGGANGPLIDEQDPSAAQSNSKSREDVMVVVVWVIVGMLLAVVSILGYRLYIGQKQKNTSIRTAWRCQPDQQPEQQERQSRKTKRPRNESQTAHSFSSSGDS